jgi:glycosyltransferase involved in cell wall biosynthesis
MVVFSYYPDDPRVRREAEALVAAGMEVDVCCLRRSDQHPRETVGGVEVHRLPVVRKRQSPLRYLWEYASFILLAGARLARIHRASRLDVVHVHNMPDILVASALVPRIGGARVILDLHDPMPEVFMTKYGLAAEHPLIRVLRGLERWSIRAADAVLTPNETFRNVFVARGCPPGRIAVVMNTPDPAIFLSDGRGVSPFGPRRPGEFRLMYHGTIVERHGLDTAVDAVVRVREHLPGAVLHVFGEGDFVGPFLARVEERAAGDCVVYHGQVSLEAIAAAIPHIDAGIIPNKRSVFTEINLPTRIFEYLAHGKPVVAPRTQGVREYFGEDALHFFEPGSVDELVQAILAAGDPERSASILARGTIVFEAHRWEHEQKTLLRVVTGLVNSRKRPSLRPSA